ncbi:uncharacterized protein LOC144107650 isoform X2 [Amblyomma americanum]
MKRRIRFTAMLITPLSSDLQDVSDAPSYDIGDQAPIAVDEEESGNDLIGWSSAIEDSESAGKMTEAEARRELSMALGSPIYEVGLIIHPEQPWLCCSPDGIHVANGNKCLVEIKCPFSLKENYRLIDYEHELSSVPYIEYSNGHLMLKKGHAYYTQVMVMLCILNLDHALFFVYSPQHSITVTVKKDDGFLAEYIPKLEGFYFKHLLRFLTH